MRLMLKWTTFSNAHYMMESHTFNQTFQFCERIQFELCNIDSQISCARIQTHKSHIEIIHHCAFLFVYQTRFRLFAMLSLWFSPNIYSSSIIIIIQLKKNIATTCDLVERFFSDTRMQNA